MSKEKQLEEFNFKFVGNFDVSAIQNIVSKFDAEWNLDTSRQTKSIHHSRTISYHILWYPLMWEPGQEYVPSVICQDENLFLLIKDIVNELENKYNGKAGRVTLVNLPKHKLVTPHRDRSIYSKVINRVHVPIITNPDVYFSVEDETVNMKPGEAYEVNNAKLHGAYNFGDSDRVHLMIDIINNDLIGEREYIGDSA
jgi:hypothetical protein